MIKRTRATGKIKMAVGQNDEEKMRERLPQKSLPENGKYAKTASKRRKAGYFSIKSWKSETFMTETVLGLAN
jgi:hypothetical protein